MTPGDFAASQETEITGELVRHMKEVIEDPSAPLWMAHFVSVVPQLRDMQLSIHKTKNGLAPITMYSQFSEVQLRLVQLQ